MATAWSEGALEPISEEAPCGISLEESGDLFLLESYQIFGQDSLDPAPREASAAPKREARKSDRPPNWRELEDLATACLAKSKDLRALAHLGACRLRTMDVPAFLETITVASRWLETYWDSVYPRVAEDPVITSSSLSSFADRAAIIDGLRRAPLVSGPLGRFSFRDLDAPLPADAEDGEGQKPGPDGSAIRAAFAAMPIDDLRALHAAVGAGVETLRAIEQTMTSQAGSDAMPSFDLLAAQLQAMQTALRTRLSEHPDAVAGVDDATGEGVEGGGAKGPVGAIATRQDAIRALDAVADFFRRSEPSSPIPMIVDRAKRLVSKNFLEVLADLAPGGLAEARSAGGIRDQMSEQISE
jgi:type VI secretion system protein ImpA